MKKFIAAVALACALSVLAAQKPEDEIEYRMLEFDQGMTAFEDGPTPRLRVRANFYRTKDENPWHSSPGQVSIEHGLPKWKPEYAQVFSNLPAGKRWRLGSNYWTNLSTDFELRDSDATLPAGYYYLVLEKGAGDIWQLVFLRPSEVRKLQIDAWHVNRQESGSAVFQLELKKSLLEQPTEALQIRMLLEDADPKNFRIDIRFGPNRLVTPLISITLG